METAFGLANLYVVPFWLAMILAPGWRGTHRLVSSPWIVGATAIAYAALLLPSVAPVLPLLARPQLGPIAALLGTELGATVAWLHFLTFDLFVGRWIFLEARAAGARPWLSSPILALTLLMGPAGLLAWLVARRFLRARPPVTA
jgi:hypothetical protein